MSEFAQPAARSERASLTRRSDATATARRSAPVTSTAPMVQPQPMDGVGPLPATTRIRRAPLAHGAPPAKPTTSRIRRAAPTDLIRRYSVVFGDTRLRYQDELKDGEDTHLKHRLAENKPWLYDPDAAPNLTLVARGKAQAESVYASTPDVAAEGAFRGQRFRYLDGLIRQHRETVDAAQDVIDRLYALYNTEGSGAKNVKGMIGVLRVVDNASTHLFTTMSGPAMRSGGFESVCKAITDEAKKQGDATIRTRVAKNVEQPPQVTYKHVNCAAPRLLAMLDVDQLMNEIAKDPAHHQLHMSEAWYAPQGEEFVSVQGVRYHHGQLTPSCHLCAYNLQRLVFKKTSDAVHQLGKVIREQVPLAPDREQVSSARNLAAYGTQLRAVSPACQLVEHVWGRRASKLWAQVLPASEDWGKIGEATRKLREASGLATALMTGTRLGSDSAVHADAVAGTQLAQVAVSQVVAVLTAGVGKNRKAASKASKLEVSRYRDRLGHLLTALGEPIPGLPQAPPAKWEGPEWVAVGQHEAKQGRLIERHGVQLGAVEQASDLAQRVRARRRSKLWAQVLPSPGQWSEIAAAVDGLRDARARAATLINGDRRITEPDLLREALAIVAAARPPLDQLDNVLTNGVREGRRSASKEAKLEVTRLRDRLRHLRSLLDEPPADQLEAASDGEGSSPEGD